MGTRKKSLITVYEATKIAYKGMDKKFHSIRLCQMVRELTGRAFLMDGTILRRLRDLRSNHPEEYSYKVVNQDESIYQKVRFGEAEIVG
jgi:hypothetical protein